MLKIEKINELKRLNKNSINYEILTDMVKEPVDIEEFIKTCLPKLKEETTEILEQFDNKLSEVLQASEQLQLHIEILKTDIENLDFIKCNEVRMDFIKTVEIPVCLQYKTDSSWFKISDTDTCSECQKEKAQTNSVKIQNISSQDIFFKGIPKLVEQYTEAEEEAKRKEKENQTLKHLKFTNVQKFMEKFFELPIVTKTGKEPLNELKLISESYKAYIDRIKHKIHENPELKKKQEENLV